MQWSLREKEPVARLPSIEGDPGNIEGRRGEATAITYSDAIRSRRREIGIDSGLPYVHDGSGLPLVAFLERKKKGGAAANVCHYIMPDGPSIKTLCGRPANRYAVAMHTAESADRPVPVFGKVGEDIQPVNSKGQGDRSGETQSAKGSTNRGVASGSDYSLWGEQGVSCKKCLAESRRRNGVLWRLGLAGVVGREKMVEEEKARQEGRAARQIRAGSFVAVRYGPCRGKKGRVICAGLLERGAGAAVDIEKESLLFQVSMLSREQRQEDAYQ